MFRLFEGDQHAEVYQKYRLRTPQFVVQKVMGYLEEELPRPHGLALDVGCGSGQSTLCLAPYFETAAGYDVSAAQIGAARGTAHLPGNVAFDVAPAEKLPVADRSAELVFGSASFHWFDFPSFFREVDRVLVPNGVAAAVAHTNQRAVHPTRETELNELMDAFAGHLLAVSHERARYALDGYKDLPLPYEQQVRYSGMRLELKRTVGFMVGAYSTWSPYQQLYRDNPQKTEAALQKLQDDCLKVMDVATTPEETPLTLSYNFCLAMCRKPATS